MADKTPFFTKMETINWTRFWWIIGVVFVFWSGIVAILPENIYKPVAVVLSAAQAALLFAARGNKYVKDRVVPPMDGKP